MKSFIENRKILYVDDEAELLNSFKSLLRKENLQITTLQHSSKIEEMLRQEGPFAVVLSDQKMPEYDGVAVLETTSRIFPDTLRILITGYADYNDTIRAINRGGINSYIAKPWNDDEIKKLISDLVTQYNLKYHNKYLLNALDDENKKLNVVLEGTVAQTVRILGDVANQISPQVAAFSEAMKMVGYSFLESFSDLNYTEKWEIKRALELANFGIALLPASVHALIEKHGLSVLDRSPVARNYHILAAGLLKNIPQFENVARIIELQSKNFNGMGEPHEISISGTDIPFGARLLHIIIDLVRPASGLVRGKELLYQMGKMPEKYDIDIVKILLGQKTETNFKTEERLLNIADLQSGMILLENVRLVNGQLLLKENMTLTETLINILVLWHQKEPVHEPIKVKCIYS